MKIKVEDLTDESVVTDPTLLDIGEDPLPADLREEREAELDDYEARLTSDLLSYLDEHGDDEPVPEGLPDEDEIDKAAGGSLLKDAASAATQAQDDHGRFAEGGGGRKAKSGTGKSQAIIKRRRSLKFPIS